MNQITSKEMEMFVYRKPIHAMINIVQLKRETKIEKGKREQKHHVAPFPVLVGLSSLIS